MIIDILHALCFMVVVGLFVVKRARIGVLEIYILLFVYFYLGPYLAFRFGIPIFHGIEKFYLGEATFVFTLASLALLLGTLIPARRKPAFDIKPRRIDSRFVRLCTIYPAQALLLFGLLNAVASGIAFSGLDKTSIITIVGWSHYPTLTLVPCMLLAYMALVSAGQGLDKPFCIAIVLFTGYALITNERDFVLLGVPIYFWITGKNTVKLRHAIVISVPLLLIFTTLSQGRSEIFSGGLASSFLNQGSNLMVMTQTLSFIHEGGAHIYGLSYLSAIVNALSLGQVRLWGPGAAWLSEYYSAGAGAYGFSLEAEAYLNFGMIGVFVVFFTISRYYKFVERLAIAGSHFGLLLKYHFSFFILYGIRGEFLTILKSAQYSLIIYLFIVIAMGRGVITLRAGRAYRSSNDRVSTLRGSDVL